MKNNTDKKHTTYTPNISGLIDFKRSLIVVDHLQSNVYFSTRRMLEESDKVPYVVGVQHGYVSYS